MNGAAHRQVHREIKYVVEPPEADRLEKLFEREIALRPRFPGQRDAIVRSVYLDYADGSLTRQTLAHPEDSTKVRYKRYEDPGDRTKTYEVSVWIEVKTRRGDLITKERAPYPGVMLKALLAGRSPPPDVRLLREVFARGALRPVAGVRYRRVAFEEKDASLRVTIDLDVTFQRPYEPGDQTDDIGALPACVVEIKPMGDVPAWFEEAMRAHAPSPFSKFEHAVRTLTPP